MIKTEDLSRGKALFAYLEKKRNNQRFVKSIETSASFILITFFMIFAIRPTAYTIASLLGEIKAKEILSEQKLKPKIKNIIEAQQNFALIQQDYHLVESSLPDSPSYSQVATQVLGSGYQSQLPLSQINFNFNQPQKQKTEISPFDDLSSYRLSVNQSADFSSALELISRIYSNRRLFEIEDIRFNRELTDKENIGQIKFSLSLKVPYWQSYGKK